MTSVERILLGEGGYPGQVDVTVKYTLTDDHRLTIDFHATTNKTTPINMTNHTYFNLGGHVRVTIEDSLYYFHRVDQRNRSWSTIHRSGRSIPGIERRTDPHRSVNDPRRMVVRSSLFVSVGEVASVKDTPFDFRTSTAIGARINDSFDGYDMMFVVKGTGKRDFGKWVAFAAVQFVVHTFSLSIRRLVDAKSGRAISIESTQKGLQFYTGNFLDGVQGREGAVYNKHGALCLETQNYSDSLNNQVRTTSKWFVSFVSFRFLFYRLSFQVSFFVLVMTIRNKPSSISTWNNCFRRPN